MLLCKMTSEKVQSRRKTAVFSVSHLGPKTLLQSRQQAQELQTLVKRKRSARRNLGQILLAFEILSKK